jgi:hypothetical protein
MPVGLGNILISWKTQFECFETPLDLPKRKSRLLNDSNSRHSSL